MQKKQVLNSLLAVSAVAAMLGSFGVQAQTSGQTAQQMSQQGAQGNPNLTGKAANDGTVGNPNSQGMEDRSGQVGSSSTATTQSGGTGAAATGTASGETKLSRADKKALTDMAMSNMAEIETGKLALSKSQNQEVKTFAQRMVDDHTKAQTEVQAVAQAKGVTLPTELDAKHKAKGAMLEKLSGDAFDRAYMKQSGLADHRDTHGKLKKGLSGAKDPDIKALAAKMTPVVEQHLKSAEQLSASQSRTATGQSGATGNTDSGK
jgi:predicted outer membrane protein